MARAGRRRYPPPMARHVIPLDTDSALEMIWDDEAGTVEGDTVHAAMMIDERARGATLDMSDDGRIRIPATLDLSRDGRILFLEDPAHDPRDFWHLVPYWCLREPLRSRMPAILRDAAPTEGRPAPPPRRIDANGVERDAIEGAEFVW